MTAMVDNAVTNLRRANAELQRQLDQRTVERDEALQRETATAEILGVINSSPGDLAPVFQVILEKAHALCGVESGGLVLFDGDQFRLVANHAMPERHAQNVRRPYRATPGSAQDRLLRGERFVHIEDVRATPTSPQNLSAIEAGTRTLLFVPLRKDGALLGFITSIRREVRPFLDQEITLLENFAAQAVIAMENARLLNDTREALERQTATSDILRAIAAAPGDADGTLRKIAETTGRLFGAVGASFRIAQGDEFIGVGVGEGAEQIGTKLYDDPANRPTVAGRNLPGTVVRENRQIHMPDLDRLDPEFVDWPGPPVARGAGIRTLAGTPLRTEGRAIGALIVYRNVLRPFEPVELQLLQSFADQAVIAIENARLINETREALDQQTATAEVLGVINSSPGDLAPVFDAMLEKALRLCDASFGVLYTYDGESFHSVGHRGVSAALADFLREPIPLRLDLIQTALGSLGRLMRGDSVVHDDDIADSEAYRAGYPLRRALVDLDGARTGLWVALRKDSRLLGTFVIYRREVSPFTDKQIALLQNFAAQAVIAMENARLITETREALEQQTATAEVLGVINSSPGDLAPVFDAMLEKAARLCETAFGLLNTWDGERFHLVAFRGVPDGVIEAMRQPMKPVPGTFADQLVRGENVICNADLREAEGSRVGPGAQALARFGARAHAMVALRNDGKLLGAIAVYRREARPFSDKQIGLLQNFAAQAVIAMENARLITETREALEQQTATAEVLQVINSSPGDLAPVFDAILEKAHSLCGAAKGSLIIYDGQTFRGGASRGLSDAFTKLAFAPQDRPPSSPPGRLLAGERLVHIPDIRTEAAPIPRAAAELEGARTVLYIPLRKDDALLGYITVLRQEVRPFTDKQIALLQNFAAQAVIAMENARLITETREALDQQTATAEVLEVINSSPDDLTPVFDVILEKAHTLCGVDHGSLQLYDGELYRAVAIHGAAVSVAEQLRRPRRPDANHPLHRLFAGEPFAHVPDLAEIDTPGARNMVKLAGLRTVLYVALRKEESLLGFIGVGRKEVRPFTDKEIALLHNFAAQAVIAIENARLLTETREARDDAEGALRQLKAAQASLIQAEKMASLGQLTAGIAHEIKNPLNFVNNFASLSVELLDELKETTTPALAALDEDKRADAAETIDLLSGNLEKIAEHGKRADNIVKSMLEHSRGVTGERREVDLNGLIDEALNLAYHGARAQDASFNIALEHDYAPGLRPIELAPQEITRVFLNLFGNGFYAAAKRARDSGGGSFRPTLTVATRDLGGAVEVTVRDNGTGIAPEIRDRLFQPFFTTKPTGEGTGLGLSICYDIVTQQHGGTIEVDSEEGVFTEFRIRLPRTQLAAAR